MVELRGGRSQALCHVVVVVSPLVDARNGGNMREWEGIVSTHVPAAHSPNIRA